MHFRFIIVYMLAARAGGARDGSVEGREERRGWNRDKNNARRSEPCDSTKANVHVQETHASSSKTKAKHME